MNLYLAALESSDGTWEDEPITGVLSRKEARKLALAKWKIEDGERIVIYKCRPVETISGKPEPAPKRNTNQLELAV